MEAPGTGGGANTTDDQIRIGVAMNYCAGFIRQQENQHLEFHLKSLQHFPHNSDSYAGSACTEDSQEISKTQPSIFAIWRRRRNPTMGLRPNRT